MFKSGAKTVAAKSGDSKITDVVVVLAAGLFFANIVMGTGKTTEPTLAYATQLSACGASCTAIN